MIARVRVVTEVQYDYDVGEPDDDGNLPDSQGAADEANTNVLASVKNAVPGTVLDDQCLVEEVRQA